MTYMCIRIYVNTHKYIDIWNLRTKYKALKDAWQTTIIIKMQGHWNYLIPNIVCMSKRHDPTKMQNIPKWYEAHGLWKYLIPYKSKRYDLTEMPDHWPTIMIWSAWIWKYLIPNTNLWEQKARPTDIQQWHKAHGHWKYQIPNTCTWEQKTRPTNW